MTLSYLGCERSRRAVPPANWSQPSNACSAITALTRLGVALLVLDSPSREGGTSLNWRESAAQRLLPRML